MACTRHRRSEASCSTGSFLVAGPGVFRCVQDSFIHDPCYLDMAAGNAARSVVVCVDDAMVAQRAAPAG